MALSCKTDYNVGAQDIIISASDTNIVNEKPQISMERERLVVDETKITLPNNLDNSVLIRECLKAGNDLLKKQKVKEPPKHPKDEVSLKTFKCSKPVKKSYDKRSSSISLMSTRSLPSQKSSFLTVVRPHTAHATRQASSESVSTDRVSHYLAKLHAIYEDHLKTCFNQDQTFKRPQRKHFPAMSTSYVFGRPLGIVDCEKTLSGGIISREGEELKSRKSFDCKNKTDILFH